MNAFARSQSNVCPAPPYPFTWASRRVFCDLNVGA